MILRSKYLYPSSKFLYLMFCSPFPFLSLSLFLPLMQYHTHTLSYRNESMNEGFLPPVPSPYDCNFERDFCQWTQDTSDVFDWTRNAGATSSQNTGPSFDHTFGNGEFSSRDTVRHLCV